MNLIKTYKATPEPTLRRLPRYVHLLNTLKLQGLTEVSSTIIANEMSLDPTQVRKDIEYTGVTGRPKTGYNIELLIKGIKGFLNWNKINDAFIAGVGSLGTAMLGYTRFKEYGLNYVAAFDNDQTKIGTKVHNVPIFSLEKIPDLAKKMKIKIGVIAVPAFAAQSVANYMIEGGIKAIWNFAPIQIKLPENIVLENAQLTQSLAVLTRRLFEND